LIADSGMFEGIATFAVIVVAVVWLVMAYNTLDAAAARTALAWGNIDALLRQRHDELARFLEACEPHARQDRAAIDEVQAARGVVFEARHARDTVALGQAENALQAALARLLTTAESGAARTNDDVFAAASRRLEALESGLRERRAIFNDAVRQNNAAVGRFPGNVVALLGRFRAVPPIDVEQRQG
jgi:LemA protein